MHRFAYIFLLLVLVYNTSAHGQETEIVAVTGLLSEEEWSQRVIEELKLDGTKAALFVAATKTREEKARKLNPRFQLSESDYKRGIDLINRDFYRELASVFTLAESELYFEIRKERQRMFMRRVEEMKAEKADSLKQRGSQD